MAKGDGSPHYETGGLFFDQVAAKLNPPKPEEPPSGGGHHGFHFPKFDMPDFSSLIADLEKQRLQQLREAERRAAEQEISSLYANRIQSEKEAIRVVDERITNELDRARLTGVDYVNDPEGRLKRISNLFAEIYSEESDNRLTTLMQKYGGPDMTTAERDAVFAGTLSYVPEFSITRGEITGQDTTGQIADTRPAGGRVDPLSGSILDLPQTDENSNLLGV
jgi:hypothetical protein